MTEFLIALGGGAISGGMCVVAMKVDIAWLKKEVDRLDKRLDYLVMRSSK